jgi:protein gp37
MSETTGIGWTDHTFNPWIGCTKVSQGCKLCYAETQNNRYGWNPEGWGAGKPRKRTSAANWKKPIQWAKQAVKDGVIRRVFCSSLADVMDDEVPGEWTVDLTEMIESIGRYIGGLEWLILTKRPENIRNVIPDEWLSDPPDYVRLGVTCEDQANANKRIPQLINAWKGKNFLSVEPMISRISLVGFASPTWGMIPESAFIHWVICGGESGAGCRPMDIEWARDLRDQCQTAGVPFFFKQLGGFPDKRHDPAGWPEDLRVQEFPLLRQAARDVTRLEGEG